MVSHGLTRFDIPDMFFYFIILNGPLHNEKISICVEQACGLSRDLETNSAMNCIYV